MKKVVLACLALLMISCGAENKGQVVINGFALGTTYHIVIVGDTTAGITSSIASRFEQINNSMSIFNPNSRLSKINRGETDRLDSMLISVISLAQEVSAKTDGTYDVTVKPLTDAWGFAAKQKTKEPNVDSLLQYVGYQKIKIEGDKLIKEREGVQLDLNSVAKGATVDMIAKLIEDRGHKNYLVEIGGEVFARGKNLNSENWRIGIDKPEDGNYIPGENLQEIIKFSNLGLATSGNYRRFYLNDKGEKIVHTLDPKTGLSAHSRVLSATVISQSSALSDALATSMMAMGLKRATQFAQDNPDVYIYLIYSGKDGQMLTFSSNNLDLLLDK